jgi:hypothetical protein
MLYQNEVILGYTKNGLYGLGVIDVMEHGLGVL